MVIRRSLVALKRAHSPMIKLLKNILIAFAILSFFLISMVVIIIPSFVFVNYGYGLLALIWLLISGSAFFGILVTVVEWDSKR
jgi:hypothetical protein